MTKMVKKTIALLTALIILAACFSFIACNTDGGKNPVASISVTSFAKEYLVGDKFGAAKINAVYADETEKSVDVTEDMLKGFDTTVAGERTVIVTYEGAHTQFVITIRDLYVDSIEVKEFANTYIRTDSFKGGTLTAKYSDGTTADVEITAAMVTGFSSQTVGEKNLIVTYKKRTAEFTIMINEPAVSGIEITEDTPKAYYLFDSFAEVSFTVTLENGETSIVKYTTLENITGFDTETAGTKLLTVSYEGKSAQYEVTVSKKLTGFIVKSFDEFYEVGEAFKAAVITATYNDESSGDVEVTEDMLEDFDTSTAGKKTVKINYEGQQSTFEITVILVSAEGKFNLEAEDEGFVDLSEAALQTGAGNKFENETQDAAGTKYSNGASGYSTSNLSVEGNKIKISFYSSQTGVFDFGMRAQSNSNSGRSSQTVSGVLTMAINGNTLGAQGTIAAASSTNTAWRDMTVWTDVIMGQDIPLVKGENTVILTCLVGTSTARFPNIDYFTVDVKEYHESPVSEITIDDAETKTEYYLNDEFDKVTFNVKFENNETTVITYTDTAKVEGFDTSSLGEKTVTVSYRGVTKDYMINVVKKLTGITVKTFEMLYDINDSLKPTVITATYNDGSDEDITVTEDMLSGFDTTTTGAKTVTVNYQGFTATFNIDVADPSAVSSITVIPAETVYDYVVGDAFGSVKFTVALNGGETSTVEYTNTDNITGFDTTTAGTKTLTVAYRGVTTTYVITVSNVLAGISMKSYDAVYSIGDEFGAAIITAEYNDGTNEDITVTADMLSGFDTSTFGEKSVTVTYDGKTTEFTIAVALINAAGQYKVQAEDSTTVDTSEIVSTDKNGVIFEGTTNIGTGKEPISNEAEGTSTCNMSAIGNKLTIRFYSKVSGTFNFGMRVQSASSSGKADQLLSGAMSITANGEEQTVTGTALKASTEGGNWQYMRNWTLLENVCSGITLTEGWNTVIITCKLTTGTERFPNIDYFIITAI